MKKIFTTFLLLSTALVYAQDNKNKFVVNANLSVSNGSNNSLGLGGFNIGYFFTNQFSIGVTANYNGSIHHFSQEAISSYPVTSLSTDKYLNNFVGVFARYNFVPKNKFSFFLSLNNSFFWYTFKHESIFIANGYEDHYTSTGYSKGYRINLNPGIIYFFHPKFSTEITLGSVFYTTERATDINFFRKASGFGTDLFTSGFNLGFSYYFGCKNKNTEQ
jgi:hypothetical protein